MPSKHPELPPDVVDALQLQSFTAEEQDRIVRILERVAGLAHASGERYHKALLAVEPIKQLPIANMQSVALFLRHEMQSILEHPHDPRCVWENVLRLDSAGKLPSLQTGEKEQWLFPPLKPRRHQRYAANWVMKQTGNCLLVMPTGFGKTLVATQILEKTLVEFGLPLQAEEIPEGAFMCIVTAPPRLLVTQHVKDFASGKYGPLVKGMLERRMLRVGTPQMFLHGIESIAHIPRILLFADEGDYGIQAGTGNYSIFPLAEKLNMLGPQNDRRLIALTATAKENDLEGFRTMFGIEHVLSENTDPVYERLIDRQRRKREVRIVHCPATWEHLFIVEQLQQWILDEVETLRDCFVNIDPEKKHFPRFPVSENDPEKVPSVTYETIEDLLSRLDAVEKETFEDDEVVPPRRRRSLRGLWDRMQARRNWNHELDREAKKEIKQLRRGLYGFRSLIDLYHTTDCNSYAPILQKAYNDGEEIAALEAQKLLTQGHILPDDIEKFLRRFDKIIMPFEDTIEQMRRALLRVRVLESMPEIFSQLERNEDYRSIQAALETLAAGRVHTEKDLDDEQMRRARLYKFFHNKWLRRAIEGIQRSGAHPKEVRFRQFNKKTLQKPQNRILTSVQYKATLFHLLEAMKEDGMHGDFLIGGSGKQIEVHNLMARKALETGRTRHVIGTTVMDRGMDLKGANVLFEYDLSFSDRQRVQRHGRVGRSDAIAAKCYAFLLSRKGSRDEILARLITEGSWKAGTEAEAGVGSAAEAIPPPIPVPA